MADIVHQKVIAIAPTIHVEMTGGSKVVVPERPAHHHVARLAIGGEPERVFKHKKLQRLPESGPPMKAFMFGVQRNRCIGRWAVGTASPDRDVESIATSCEVALAPRRARSRRWRN